MGDAGHLSYQPRIALIDRAFQRVRQALHRKSPTEFFMKDSDSFVLKMFEPENQDISSFKKGIARYRSDSGINYGDVLEFSKYDHAYYYRNLFKFLIASDFLTQNCPFLSFAPEFADVGCGVGTFGTAWREFATTAPSRTIHEQKVHFVDKYRYQLLFARAAQSLLYRKNSAFIEEDISLFKLGLSSSVVRLAGFLFCPNTAGDPYQDFKLGNMLGSCNLIVDYAENLQTLKNSLRQRRLNVHEFHISSRVPTGYIESVKTLKINVHILVAGVL